MSMATSSPGNLDRNKLHPRCKQTCRFLLVDLWAAVELLLPVPSVCEPTCQTSWSNAINPNLWEGFCALLAIQETCTDDQVLICLLQYLFLVNLVGCHLEFGQLLHPVLQDIPGVGIDIGYAEGCLHGDHWLRHMGHLFIIMCPEGSNLHPAVATQCHRLRISVRDDPIYHVCAWEHEILACNLVQAGLGNVHIDLVVFEVFLKFFFN